MATQPQHTIAWHTLSVQRATATIPLRTEAKLDTDAQLSEVGS